MKIATYLTILSFIIPVAATAQDETNNAPPILPGDHAAYYSYDAAGNRILRAYYGLIGPIDVGDSLIAPIDLGDGYLCGRKVSASYKDNTLTFYISRLSQDDDCRLSLVTADGKQVSSAKATSVETELPMNSIRNEALILSASLNGERKSWKFVKK